MITRLVVDVDDLPAVNRVVLGNNLSVLRSWPDHWIDLIYLDPPFLTGRDFGAFDDRWDDVHSYVAWMTERLIEMLRILKPTGSLYLHCDHHASHHLRLMLDEVFGVPVTDAPNQLT